MTTKYLLISIRNTDETVTAFDSAEEANDKAESEWNHLTANERARIATIKVVKVTEEDVEKDENGAPVWENYNQYYQPEEEDLFDSDLF